jgi:uncharacterized membrane protein YfcA
MFNLTHPRMKEKNMIDYEVINLAMPISFLGTFFGVELGKIMNEKTLKVLFALAIMWSLV